MASIAGPSSGSTIKLKLQTLENHKYEIEIGSTEQISTLKKKIQTNLQLYVNEDLKLIYKGKILKDEDSIEAAALKSNDTVVVMKSKKRTVAPAATASSATQMPATATSVPANVDPSTSAPTAVTQSASTSSAVPPTQSSATAAASAPVTTEVSRVDENVIVGLMELGGFPREQVLLALRAAFNDPDRAAEYLFNGIPPAALNSATTAPRVRPQTTTNEAPATGAAATDPATTGSVNPLAALGLPPSEIAAIRSLVAQQPQLLPLLLQQLAQTNPQAIQAIQQNPQEFMAAFTGQHEAADAGQHVIQITEEEQQSIANLVALGFERNRVIEAFLACDRNEEQAANYLFDSRDDDDDDLMVDVGRQGGAPHGDLGEGDDDDDNFDIAPE